MKKFIFAVAVVLALSSCTIPISIPGLSTPTAAIPPTATFPAPTITPLLPSPVTATDTPVIAPASPTTEIVLAPSVIPLANLTTTPATATNLPANPANTATTAAGQPTITPTLGILTYGTLPPAVPFNTITILNKSKAQAYISLQVTLNDGRYAILEYPVEGSVKVKAPLGSYVYVAWVGGNKMVGGFRLSSSDDLTIILYKDKVVFK